MQKIRMAMRHYGILLLPIGLWFLVWAYGQLAQLSWEGNRIYYGLIVFYRASGLYVLLATILSFLFLVFFISTLPRPLSKRQDALYAITLLLVVVAIPASCVTAALWNFTEFGTTFTHIARMSNDQYLYQLAYIANPSFGRSSYNLYRCDTIGFVCDRVQSVDSSTGTPYQTVGNYQAAETATLVTDPTSQGISIRVGTETIYTYRP
jgi:hypothetical protein